MKKSVYYNIRYGLVIKNHSKIKRALSATVASLFISGIFVTPVFALSNNGNGVIRTTGTSVMTTLDACGYFFGYQTSSQTHVFTEPNKTVHDNERGVWAGVYNNNGLLVNSLRIVIGNYVLNTSTSSNGVVTGTEEFHSAIGNIAQQFTYGPGVPGGYIVNVVATGQLSFLTSNTNGHCYTGPFPRP
jgi:hypothetical protein